MSQVASPVSNIVRFVVTPEKVKLVQGQSATVSFGEYVTLGEDVQGARNPHETLPLNNMTLEGLPYGVSANPPTLVPQMSTTYPPVPTGSHYAITLHAKPNTPVVTAKVWIKSTTHKDSRPSHEYAAAGTAVAKGPSGSNEFTLEIIPK